jgi:hypothetical protein
MKTSAQARNNLEGLGGVDTVAIALSGKQNFARQKLFRSPNLIWGESKQF